MQVATIGLDLAKNVFHVHGLAQDGAVGVSRSLRRSQVLSFFEKLEPCLVGMEACGASHYWARELVRLVAPTFGGFLEGALEATEHSYTVLKTGQGRSETRL